MAFPTSQENIHDQPVGAGFHGPMKFFKVKLLNGVAKDVYFDGFKLQDPDSALVIFSDTYTNASGETVANNPATSKVMSADGKYITLTHNADGNFVLGIAGKWTRI